MEKQTKKVNNDVIRDINEDTNTIKKFIYILIGVAIVTVCLYFISSKLLVKDGVDDTDDTNVEETISYDTVLGGNVFNRPEDEYYVLAYDSSSLKASYYAVLISTFDKTKGNIYFMNLDLETNKQYIKEPTNTKPTKPSELALKEPTLIKIKDGKVDKYLENLEDIEKELKQDKK